MAVVFAHFVHFKVYIYVFIDIHKSINTHFSLTFMSGDILLRIQLKSLQVEIQCDIGPFEVDIFQFLSLGNGSQLFRIEIKYLQITKEECLAFLKICLLNKKCY